MAPDSKDIYFALAPNGNNVLIPKELYEALSDFIGLQKPAGSITLQFRGGQITTVESLARRRIARP